MKRMSDITQIEWLDEDETEDPGSITQSGRRAVDVYEVNGPFFFGAADKVKEVMSGIGKPPKAFILRMRHVPAIDATGLHALEQMAKKCRHDRTRLILSEVREQPCRAIERSGLAIGEIADTFEDALERVRSA
jgi:SulP family sulfate permease